MIKYVRALYSEALFREIMANQNKVEFFRKCDLYEFITIVKLAPFNDYYFRVVVVLRRYDILMVMPNYIIKEMLHRALEDYQNEFAIAIIKGFRLDFNEAAAIIIEQNNLRLFRILDAHMNVYKIKDTNLDALELAITYEATLIFDYLIDEKKWYSYFEITKYTDTVFHYMDSHDIMEHFEIIMNIHHFTGNDLIKDSYFMLAVNLMDLELIKYFIMRGFDLFKMNDKNIHKFVLYDKFDELIKYIFDKVEEETADYIKDEYDEMKDLLLVMTPLYYRDYPTMAIERYRYIEPTIYEALDSRWRLDSIMPRYDLMMNYHNDVDKRRRLH